MKFMLEILIVSLTLSFTAHPTVNADLQTPTKTVQIKKANEITEGEKYLVLNQRAVIRPIYIETVKGKTAKHAGYLLNVNLKNTALKTSYKQIKIEAAYYDKIGKLIEKEIITLKKTILPNESLKESVKVTKYKNNNYKIIILSALAIAKK